jgi:Zn-dependent peptidase ImmA (M78 family)
MTMPKIKATFVLDAETVRSLEQVSRRWNVSKSEALRRAIRSLAATAETGHASTEVLDRLQAAAKLSASAATAWARHARAERRLAAKRVSRR